LLPLDLSKIGIEKIGVLSERWFYEFGAMRAGVFWGDF
jgi:hypothetical protein